jgi:L-methionine (R)-S-oxide reductase
MKDPQTVAGVDPTAQLSHPLHLEVWQAALDIVTEATDQTAAMQQVCALLQRKLDGYDWVGFYLVERPADEGAEPDTLVLGPYVGAPSEHTRIPFGRGICGQVAVSGETLLVPDVTEADNYLACSTKTQSELVVPMFAPDGTMLGQLDIDSHQTAWFTGDDLVLLEAICAAVGAIPAP